MFATCPRIIVQYPNRRFYDTTDHRYATLEDLRQLVLQGMGFVILDEATGADLTCSVLLNVLAENESSIPETVLSRSLLLGVIRAQSFPGLPADRALQS